MRCISFLTKFPSIRPASRPSVPFFYPPPLIPSLPFCYISRLSDPLTVSFHIYDKPLISRVRGPYGKLWTEFFPSFYGPSAKRAAMKNKGRKKRGSITCCTDRANEANKMFYYMALLIISVLKRVIESWRSVRLLTDLELTNHSTRNQSAIKWYIVLHHSQILYINIQFLTDFAYDYIVLCI